MDANALYQVAHVKGQKEQYVLIEECKQRSVCEDLVREGCFVSRDNGEDRYLVFCKADYTLVKSYPPGE